MDQDRRPDMGFHRFMKAALLDQPLTIYGDGQQTRDFTYISDVVAGNIGAMNCRKHGTVFNIGGVETMHKPVFSILGLVCKLLIFFV